MAESTPVRFRIVTEDQFSTEGTAEAQLDGSRIASWPVDIRKESWQQLTPPPVAIDEGDQSSGEVSQGGNTANVSSAKKGGSTAPKPKPKRKR